MKKKIIIGILGLAMLMPHTTQANEVKNPYGEPQKMRCTVYTASEGDITADGSRVREGIVAGKHEWLGCVAVLYECDENGELGDYIGIYEFKDTGAGIDTDGDGKWDSIKNGTSIDVYRDSLNRCYEWIEEYGDYVYIQIVRGEG